MRVKHDTDGGADNRNGAESIWRLGCFDLDEVRLSVLLPVKPWRHWQAFRSEEGGVEQLRLIAVAVIGEDRDDGLARAELTRKPDGSSNVHPRRRSHAEAFMFEKVEADGDRFLIWNLEGQVDLKSFEVCGDASLADAFGDRTAFGFQLTGRIIAEKRCARRIGKADDDIGIPFAKCLGDARKRTARADSANE